MSINDTGLMALLAHKRVYDNQKASVLAQNVANSSVPRYKQRDVVGFETFEATLKKTSTAGMMATDPRHIIPASMAGVNASTVKADSIETLPSGNNVDLEQQMAEVSQTAIDYQLQSSIA